jgi:hypothetical protein
MIGWRSIKLLLLLISYARTASCRFVIVQWAVLPRWLIHWRLSIACHQDTFTMSLCSLLWCGWTNSQWIVLLLWVTVTWLISAHGASISIRQKWHVLLQTSLCSHCILYQRSFEILRLLLFLRRFSSKLRGIDLTLMCYILLWLSSTTSSSLLQTLTNTLAISMLSTVVTTISLWSNITRGSIQWDIDACFWPTTSCLTLAVINELLIVVIVLLCSTTSVYMTILRGCLRGLGKFQIILVQKRIHPILS